MPSFVPDLTTILTFAIAAFVLAITPGPDMALQLSRALNYGRSHGIACAFGGMAGIAVHTTLVALGISVLIVAAPPLFLALKIVGAIYLIWLAIQTVRAKGGFRIAAAEARTPTLGQSFWAGVMIDVLNPKVVLFFVTFLPQFIHSGDTNAPGKLVFLGIELIVILLPMSLAVVFSASWIAKALTGSRRVQRALNWGFAGVFTTFAAVILSAQARHA